jgi:predicted component of type VI protein secretion system
MEFEQIKNIQDYLYLKYLKNLKIESNKLLINTDILTNKINDLNFNNNISETKLNDNITITETDILSENIDYLFLKPWNKINKIHKIIKIKEFIKTMNGNLKEKEDLQEEIINVIKDKHKFKLSYDEKKGKIISIPSLVFSNGKYILNID